MIERWILLDVPIQMLGQPLVVISIYQHGVFVGIEVLHEAVPSTVIVIRTTTDGESPFLKTIVVQHMVDSFGFHRL